MTGRGTALQQIGPFVLDSIRRRLLHDGNVVPLAPKAFELLLILAEKPGQVVSRDELLRRLWPDTFVVEGNLAQNVSLLRKALAEFGERLIVTVPRIGYQLAIDGAPSISKPLPAVPLQRTRAVVFTFIPLSSDREPAVEHQFAQAVCGQLMKEGVAVHPIPVAADGRDTPAIGYDRQAWAMSADVYVMGYYGRRGTTWSIVVQLVDARNSAILEAVHVRGTYGAAADMIDALRERARALAFRLEGHRHRTTAAEDGAGQEAFRHYLRGRHWWNKRTLAGLKQGLQCAHRIVEADPSFVKGHVALADTYNLMGAQYSLLSPYEAFPRAKAAALRALEIDAFCGEAYVSLGFTSWWYEWNLQAAEMAFLRALELRPLYATAYHWYAEMLASAGRFSESLAHYETAIALDPLSSIVRTDYASALSLAGKFSDCDKVLAETLRFSPDFVRAGVVRALNGLRSGALKSARKTIAGALRREPSASDIISLHGRIAAMSGEPSVARAALDRLDGLFVSRRTGRVDRAAIHAALGDFDSASEVLKDAFAAREAQIVWIPADVAMEAIRRQTEFSFLWGQRTSIR